MDNIIKVKFSEGKETQFDNSLKQWDFGQTLQVEGVAIPDGNVEVHFSLTEYNGEAPVSIGTVKDNVITVDIPYFILAKENVYLPTYDAYAWVYVTDGESGQTIRKIVFTIESRPKSTTDVPKDQKDKFLQEVRQVMAETKQIAQSVRNDADNGKFDGKDGEKGDEGKDGKSAYEYAVEGGYQGTEAEFMESLARAGDVVTKEEHEEQLLKAMVKVTTEEFDFHHITDSANYRVLDIGMEGNTEQYTGTITDDEGNEVIVPNPDYPQEITNAGVYNEETGRYEIGCVVGNKHLIVYDCDDTYTRFSVEFTVNEDMSVTMKGTNEQPNVAADFYLNKKLFLKAGTYRLSDGGVSISNGCFLAMHILGTTQYIYTNFYGTGTRGNITLGEDVYVELYIRVGGGATIDAVMYPMLIYQGDDTTYIPHASQNITLTSPVPITKWDKLVKRDGVWGWSVFAKEYNVEIDKLYIYGNICTDTEVRLYCSNFTTERNGECRLDILRYNTSEKINCCGFWYNTYLCFRLLGANLEPYGYVYDASLSASNNCNNAATAFKAMLKDKGYETIHAWVDKQSEQAFYPLPDEEQTLLNNLDTYYGITNVYNDQGCPMWLTYVADQELHWNQKLLQIQQAMI